MIAFFAVADHIKNIMATANEPLKCPYSLKDFCVFVICMMRKSVFKKKFLDSAIGDE